MLKKILRSPYPYLYLLSFYGVWLIWDGLKIPFSNPEGIISSLPSLMYNPSSNVLRFLFAVGLPPLICLIYWLAMDHEKVKSWLANKWPNRAFKVGLILLPILLAVGMGIIQASTRIETNQINGNYGGPYAHTVVDTFHEGETLGMAQSYQDSHLKPYRDFVFVHGVFQDPVRSILAFKLFGRSIGAQRTLDSLLTIATFLLYYILLLVIFRKSLVKAALGMVSLGLLLIPSNTLPVIYPYFLGIYLPFRDITTIVFLICAIIGFRYATAKNELKLLLASVAVGFVTIVTFANSIDRAFYTLALSLFWLLLLFFMSSKRLFWMKATLGYFVGCVLGLPILGLALKWDYVDFLKFLLSISSHKEFLDGIKFAKPDVEISLLLIVIGASITAAGALFIQGLGKRVPRTSLWQYTLKSVREYVVKYHFYLLLLATGIIFMRSAIGRASLDHFNYSVTWMYLMLTVVTVEAIFKVRKNVYLASFIICLLLVFITGQFMILTKKTDIRYDTFPIHLKDAEIVRTDHLQTADFLKKNLAPNQSFVTLTSEATWYYLTEKPSPVKYPIIWFAYIPKERKDLANAIQNNPMIKYIVTNNNWTSDFDYVPNDQRFPEVYKVLAKMYVPAYGFGQQTVWQRKDIVAPPAVSN